MLALVQYSEGNCCKSTCSSFLLFMSKLNISVATKSVLGETDVLLVFVCCGFKIQKKKTLCGKDRREFHQLKATDPKPFPASKEVYVFKANKFTKKPCGIHSETHSMAHEYYEYAVCEYFATINPFALNETKVQSVRISYFSDTSGSPKGE